MGVDVKDANPTRFWILLIGIVTSLSGTSGVISWAASEKAVSDAASAVAEKLIKEHEERYSKQIERLQALLDCLRRRHPIPGRHAVPL